ncbi:MAG: recN [Bacteroidetes bacterium]|jgi:DNA repair protein RecN (Recombination protein N)|nr:recN [Bacteroidota bacterium]MDF2452007.1 recN [Bacteroidota bacterium]
MLHNLRIQNFALIEETEVRLNQGLTVITGETGAGKSILLGALGLTLGNRADVSSLHHKTKKCIIEAQFNIAAYNLKPFFESHELDYDEDTTIRREITPEGKSRAFINDTPTTLNVLKELGDQLIDIHSQHETLLLKETNFQFELVDAFSKTIPLFNDYKKQFGQLSKLRKQLDDLTAQETQAKKELDYYQFQFNELEEASIKIGEQKTLEEESETLENAEFIKGNLVKSSLAISGGEENIVSALALVKQQLQSVSKFGKQFNELFERINSATIELKELASDINNCEEDVIYDNARLEEVNIQLDKLNRLLKKHGVNSEEELLGIKNDIETKLQQFSSLEVSIEKTQKEIRALEKQCQSLAKDLSDKRQNAIAGIEQNIKTMLSSLSMANAQFKIELKPLDTLTANGLDAISFLFTANKGAEFKELHKTASGGELSRLMLCLKALLAERTALPTIIFDEIDTGVSGDVADKIGNILFAMGKSMQVITITHLPQMASKGSNHLFVFKSDTKDKTTSSIKTLSPEERVAEIAKMLSTGTPTETALKNAKELLNA